MNKKDIEVCEKALVKLNNDSRIFIPQLKKTFPKTFGNAGIDEAVRTHFYASVYCATLSLGDFVEKERADAIQELMVQATSRADDCYFSLKEINKAHLEWDEPLYKPSFKYPYESLARFLYLKWGLPKQTIKLGNSVVQRPNLTIVYVIDASLQIAEKVWKGLC